jgi:2-dehydro-3-deoxyphosphogluconate aldolase/(4S)-4-hydroxy-2-oxoglutarate aldolase
MHLRSKSEVVALLIRSRIIVVVRAKDPSQALRITEALVAGGVTAVEITMTTPNAISAIREASWDFGAHTLIGVGTVLNAQTCHLAVEAGAEFVVSPITRPEIATAAHAAGRPVMLGAYTPTEAQLAYEAAADFIKIFPADGLGASYIKALLAPLPHLRVVPTGGVTLNNMGEFFAAGCAALGIGSSLLDSRSLKDSDWPQLTKRASEFVDAAAKIPR